MQSPGLYVQTENETVMDILMIDHQMNQQVLAAVSPIEDLVSAVEMDYSEYRKRYKKLYILFAGGPLFRGYEYTIFWRTKRGRYENSG